MFKEIEERIKFFRELFIVIFMPIYHIPLIMPEITYASKYNNFGWEQKGELVAIITFFSFFLCGIPL